MIKKAFTMAEILLAMTIIGVISVLVLPTVTSGTNAKQFLVTYKKAISVLNQSVDSNYAMSGWDFAGTHENYATAVGEILRNRVGATDEDRQWTITGSAGSGFIDDCVKTGRYAGGSTSCLASNKEPSLVVNKPSSGSGETEFNKNTHVFTMKDGLASIIILGEKYGTDEYVPCRAAGQRTINPAKNSSGDVVKGYSSAANYCLGYLDVNGPTGPNQVVTCASAADNVAAAAHPLTAELTVGNCKVANGMIFDVYPIIIYGDTIAPATPAALAILQERFSN